MEPDDGPGPPRSREDVTPFLNHCSAISSTGLLTSTRSAKTEPALDEIPTRTHCCSRISTMTAADCHCVSTDHVTCSVATATQTTVFFFSRHTCSPSSPKYLPPCLPAGGAFYVLTASTRNSFAVSTHFQRWVGHSMKYSEYFYCSCSK